MRQMDLMIFGGTLQLNFSIWLYSRWVYLLEFHNKWLKTESFSENHFHLVCSNRKLGMLKIEISLKTE